MAVTESNMVGVGALEGRAGFSGAAPGLKEVVVSAEAPVQVHSTIREPGIVYVCANASLVARLPQGWGAQQSSKSGPEVWQMTRLVEFCVFRDLL